ncbi:hypothetical protein [Rubrivirga sp. IMCC43871]
MPFPRRGGCRIFPKSRPTNDMALPSRATLRSMLVSVILVVSLVAAL